MKVLILRRISKFHQTFLEHTEIRILKAPTFDANHQYIYLTDTGNPRLSFYHHQRKQ